MCWLGDQRDFGIHHHIIEKPCGALLLWTRGHTVYREKFLDVFFGCSSTQLKMAKVFSVCDRDEVERTIQRRKKSNSILISPNLIFSARITVRIAL